MFFQQGNYAGIKGKLPPGISGSILDETTENSTPLNDSNDTDNEDDVSAIFVSIK